jgi:hypothetical protein
MTGDISDFYVHEAQVETFAGAGAYGDVYAAPVTVSCFAEDKIRLVRAKDGEQVVSGSTLYMAVTDGALFPPDSRVTVDGRVSYVITQDTNDAPGLGLPEHAAITLK